MAQKPGYERWPFKAILSLIAPSIDMGYYDIEINEDNETTSCAMWMYATEEGRDWYLANHGKELSTEQGDEVIINHFITDTGAGRYMRKILELIGTQNPNSKYVYGLRGFRNNRVCKLPILRRG
jgi:hemolysin-activating ACP:hemolysin acyltransferase